MNADKATLTVVPTLESLARDVVAQHIEVYNAAELSYYLPFGGTRAVLARLASSGRLREETIKPLLCGW